MADPKKGSEMDSMVVFAPSDFIYVVDRDYVSNTAVNKISSLKDFCNKGFVSNTVIRANFTTNGQSNILRGNSSSFYSNTTFYNRVTANDLTISNNHLSISNSKTPANSSITVTKGEIFWDTNYLYVATANNTLKRVALSSF